MRFIVASCALLSLCSAVRAERINIEAASATYFSRTETLQLELWFDRSVDVPGAYIAVGGWRVDEATGHEESFSISNSWATRTDRFVASAIEANERGEVIRNEIMRELTRPLSSNRFVIQIPFADTGLSDPLFQMGATVNGSSNPRDTIGLTFDVMSAIDDRVIHTPEPSTFVLLGLAAAHLIWLPRLRKRFGKRHVGWERAASNTEVV